MTVHFVTGKLGGGKTLVCVNRALEYLNSGRPVATNLDLFFDRYPDSYTTSKPYCIRIPDQPSSQDLIDLGYGNTSPDESKNGLLIFDECGTWFNSHNWNQPDRKEFIDVLIHIRKYGWDCIFIVQHFEMIDKQARQAICEFLVTCTRTDKLNIPFVSFFTKLATGKPFPLPRMHVGKVMYGYDSKALQADRWIYRGTELFDFYDTKQIFSPLYDKGSFCYLKPSNFHYDKNTKLKAKKDYQKRSIKRLWHLRPPVLFFFIGGIALSSIITTAFGIFFSDQPLSVISDKSSLNSGFSVEENIDFPLDSTKIVLNGVFHFNEIRKYYFTVDGEPYYPEVDGYAYLPFGDCGATLVNSDESFTLLC